MNMSDIELVIRISEEKYKDIQGRDWKNGKKWFSEEWQAIHNGTPLPKGHGRLIDADKANKKMQYYHDDCEKTSVYTRLGFETAMNVVNDAPTIIEADTESEET